MRDIYMTTMTFMNLGLLIFMAFLGIPLATIIQIAVHASKMRSSKRGKHLLESKPTTLSDGFGIMISALILSIIGTLVDRVVYDPQTYGSWIASTGIALCLILTIVLAGFMIRGIRRTWSGISPSKYVYIGYAIAFLGAWITIFISPSLCALGVTG